jgi:DNA polymerase alpha-associated DNA helicase A
MHADICAFPSKTLYSSKLVSHSSVASHLLQDIPGVKADSEDAKEILGTPVVFFDTAGCEYFERLEGDGEEGSRCNENEAMVVKAWVEKLVCSTFKFCRCSLNALYRLRLESPLPRWQSSHRKFHL